MKVGAVAKLALAGGATGRLSLFRPVGHRPGQ